MDPATIICQGVRLLSTYGILIGNKIKSAEDLEDVIWFELITTDLSGKENTYQLPLVLNKVD